MILNTSGWEVIVFPHWEATLEDGYYLEALLVGFPEVSGWPLSEAGYLNR